MGTQSMERIEPAAGAIVRREFGAEQTQVLAETAASAVAAREKAQVEARYVLALRRPRDMEDVRSKLTHECKRPTFAACARYKKPVGKRKNDQTGQWEQQYAEGFSIRFAEAALRCMTNIYPEAGIVYEGDDLRIMRFSITDLESNLTYSNEVSIRKTTEKKSLRQGQTALAERTNSYGDKVYVVEATDDELQMKQNSAWSKFIRNGLRFVPGDILDECEKLVRLTLSKEDAEDPDAAKRRIIDAFGEIGVGPIDLQAFLGHPLDRLQPAEMKRFREIYTAIKDGETNWADVMEEGAAIGSVEQSETIGNRKAAEAEKQLAELERQKKAAKPATTDPQPLSKEDAEKAVDTIAAGNRAKAEPVPEVDELPDPMESKLPVLYCKGALYQKNEDASAWRKVQHEQPAQKPSGLKPVFGKGKS
jgi:hypothetical protein